MPEIHDITIPDNQPGYQFYHNDVEYCIWAWLSEGGPDVYSMCLAEVRLREDEYILFNVLSQSTYKATDNKVFMRDVFIPKVNDYLTAQGGAEPNIFPEGEAQYIQLNWLIENAVTYINGQIVLTA